MAEYDADYNNTHKAFLQAFIAHSTFTYEEAKPVLAAILGAKDRQEYLEGDVTESDFNNHVSAINNAISPYDLEIRSTYHQLTRQRIFALVNSTSDNITQLATIHTADEISFVKRLLDAMFVTYNTRRHEIMALTSMQAVGLAKPSQSRRSTQNSDETQGSSGQGLSMKDAEKALKSLVEEGWFEKSRKGYYSLTPRALMELRGWLMETYNEDEEEDAERVVKIKQCFACKEIITTGQRCHNRDCLGRLHDICTQRFFTMQKARKCPICKAPWTGQDFVGERAAADTKGRAKKQGQNGNGSFVRPQSPTALDDDPDEDEDEDEEG